MPIEWDVCYVLPNIELAPRSTNPLRPSELGLDLSELKVVHTSAPQVLAVVERTPRLAAILNGFRTLGGQPSHPAVLVASSRLSQRARRSEAALIGFRNALSMTHLLPGRAAAARSGGTQLPLYSETFDVHPALIGKTGAIVSQTPSHRMLYSSTAGFAGGVNPYLGVQSAMFQQDGTLRKVLTIAWLARFRARKPNRDLDALFRALEVAFAAARLGTNPNPSVNDYGIQLGLWVSAMEVLAWAQKRHADLDCVLQLLGKYPYLPESLAEKRFHWRQKKQRRRGNAIERLYYDLYSARNDFYHGNPVTARTLLSRTRTRPFLPAVASILFRVALLAYAADHPVLRDSASLTSHRTHWTNFEYSWAVRALLQGRTDE